MKLIVIAPHPDDEVIGCCGLINNSIKLNFQIKVIIISNGELTSPAEIRQSESLRVLTSLGVSDVEFWDEADGGISQSGAIQLKYQNTVDSFRPTSIAIPSIYETHPDHRRVTRGVLNSLSERWQGEIIFYEVLTPIPQPNRIDSIDGQLKFDLLNFYESQNNLYNYPKHVSGMLTMRGASIGAEYAEAYLAYDWDGRFQNFFVNSYLVTVIIRANDQDILKNALESLIHQSYDNFEVLIIWFGEKEPPTLPGTLMGKVVIGPGPKSDNLNLGLSLAKGEFVGFLDQDDYWLPGHLAILLAEVNAINDADIIYGKYLKVFCCKKNNRIQILKKEECEEISFEPRKLLLGNFIPINSFLCRSRLAKKIKFDTDLEVFEDWDFLVRAELEGANFIHVPELVCEYRLYPEANETLDIASIHKRKGYLNFEKQILNKFVTLLNQDEVLSLLKRAKDDYISNLDLNNRINLITIENIKLTQKVGDFEKKIENLKTFSDLIDSNNIESNPTNFLINLALKQGPKISILMPICNPEPNHLIEAINSIVQQTASNWQLCIIDDASTNKEVLECLNNIQEKYIVDQRIKIIYQTTRQGIVHTTNQCARIADYEWIGFMDHDDRIHPDATLLLATEILRNPDIDAIYTDSNMIDSNGVLINTQNKPDWSPETLLLHNYINHFSCVKKTVFYEIGLLKSDFEGSQDWALWLDISRHSKFNVCHLKAVVYDWRAAKNSVAYDISTKPYTITNAKKLLAFHMKEIGIDEHQCEFSNKYVGFSHKWKVDLKPLTVIIATNDNATDLNKLLNQLFESNYPNLKIILIAHQVKKDDTNTRSLLAKIQNYPQVRIINDALPFNWARLNNIGAAHCDTPWMLFLNDDINLISHQDIHELAKYLTLNKQIGAIGAKLITPRDSKLEIQSDGVWIDSNGQCLNINNISMDHNLGSPRNVAAVVGACLLTTREAFDLTSGFDERFSYWFNDIDYCLSLRNLGYRILQASDVELLHFGSKTFSKINPNLKEVRIREDHLLFKEKWNSYFNEQFISKQDHFLSGTKILSFDANHLTS